MDPLIILLIIGLLPVAALTLFRVNAATAFLALCLGSLLGSYVASDVVSLLRGYIAPASDVTETVVQLILLWLPVFLVLFFMATTISRHQRWINLIPAISVGLVGILLSVPFLTPLVQVSIGASPVWQTIEDYQALIVAIGTVSSLLLLRMRGGVDEHHHRKHH